MHRFRDKARYWLKITIFFLPLVHHQPLRNTVANTLVLLGTVFTTEQDLM